jgi:hypothetical protein
MSTSATISVPVPVAPTAVVQTDAVGTGGVARNQPDQSNQQGDGRGVQLERQSGVSTQRITETVTAPVPGTTTTGQSETVTIRVMTVNF